VIRVLIADDEPICREGVRARLENDKRFTIVAECGAGIETVSAIQEHSPDLVFLDIQMPGLDGFEVVEAISIKRMPVVVFVTAYDQHALRAFEVNAVDYLLKPFDRERFERALTRAEAQLKHRDFETVHGKLKALLEDMGRRQQYAKRLVVKNAGRVLLLDVNEIDWIEAADNYVCLCAGRQSHLLRETLGALEARLDPSQFLRIRHSAIVNVQRVKELRPLLHGGFRVVLQNGTELTSSRRYHKKLSLLLHI
jgi:two-component system LytT family response regulator